MKIQLRRGTTIKMEGIPVVLDQDTEIEVTEKNWKLIQELQKNSNSLKTTDDQRRAVEAAARKGFE